MDWSRVDAVADELAATRAEVVGLVLLVVGGLLVSWLVVSRPMGRSEPVGEVTVASPTGVADTSSAVPAEQSSEEAATGDNGGAIGVVGPGGQGGQEGGSSGRADVAAGGQDPTGEGTVVHVTGAVARPGVVAVAAGDRVVDAVEAAGGATEGAAVEALNLARPVVDGERIHVPTPQEVEDGLVPDPSGSVGPTGPAAPGGAGTGAMDAEGRLDLNLATVDELQGLPGVGPVIAERIVAWRDANAGFEAVGQLREVSGIGEKTFQSLAGLVVVG